MMAFAAVYLLPLTPLPRAKVIHWPILSATS